MKERECVWTSSITLSSNSTEDIRRTPQKKENQTAKDLYTSTEQLSFAVLVSLKTEGNCQNSSTGDHEFFYQR
jgi:hypothetical protein